MGAFVIVYGPLNHPYSTPAYGVATNQPTKEVARTAAFRATGSELLPQCAGYTDLCYEVLYFDKCVYYARLRMPSVTDPAYFHSIARNTDRAIFNQSVEDHSNGEEVDGPQMYECNAGSDPE